VISGGTLSDDGTRVYPTPSCVWNEARGLDDILTNLIMYSYSLSLVRPSRNLFDHVVVPEVLALAAEPGLALFKTYHRTRSRVATESSTDECPTVPPPLWINIPRCSLTLAGIQK
jgi:hypothetical protein